MSRRALAPFAFGLVAFVLGAVVFLRPFALQEREVTASTPATPGNFSASIPLPLEPGDRVCITAVPLDAESQVARFVVFTYNRPHGEPLGIEARGGGYDFKTTLPGTYAEGPVEAQLATPAKPLIGEFCVSNAGKRRVALQASQIGQKFSRATPYLNGQKLEQDVPLRFHAREPKNLIQQTGRAIDHAAVFVPLPAWLIWILLALVVAGIPLGVLFAVASASVAPPAAVPDPSATAPPLPLSRQASRLGPPARRGWDRARRVPPGVWVGLIVLGAAGFYYLWGSRTKTFQLDENQYVYLARWIDHTREAIFDFNLFGRGIQRLEVWLLAIPLGLMKGADALLTARALNSLAFASAAVPAFLLARGLGARAVWAVPASVLVVAGPWVVYATTFLTEPLAYPLVVWVIWSVWRATARPSLSSALVAVLLVALAALARTAFLLFAVLLPLTVVLQELRFGDWRGGSGAAERLRRYGANVWRHRVATLMIAGGAAALLLSSAGVLPPLSRLAGGYGTPFQVHWSELLDKTAFYASRVVVGTGFLPFAIGLPWIVVELVRPRAPERHAFALVSALVIVLILYGSQTAGPDERYVMYFGAPLIVAAGVALGRRDLGPVWVAAGAVAGAVLVWRHGWNLNLGGYDFFVKPAEVFYTRTFLLRLQDQVPGFMSLASFAFGMQLLLGAAAAYGFSRGRSARTVAITLAAGVVVLQLTQAGYAMQKYVEGPGGRFSPPVTERDWIDDAIYGKAKAAMFVSGQSNSTAFDPVWLEVQFWNTSLASVYAPGQQFIQVPIGDPTHTYAEDEDTGGLTVSHPFPPYAVVARSFNDRALAGAVVKQAPYMAIDLMRPDRPLQLRYHVLDAAPDGLLGAGDEARLRVFAGGLDPARRWCAGVPFFTPVGANGRREPLPYEITGKGFRTRGEVAAEQTKIIQVPLSFGSAPHLDFKIAPPGRVKLDDGRFVSGQLGQIFVEPCKG